MAVSDPSTQPTPRGGIKYWASEDRPREKAAQRGIQALTDAEILAILLGTGNQCLSAVELGRLLLDDYGGLRGLARCSVRELQKTPGIGEDKAIGLAAAFELSRRKALQVEDADLSDPSRAAAYLRPLLEDLHQEAFIVLYLNQANRLITQERISMGGVSGTTVDPRLVFKTAVTNLASSIILAHNHPSGNLSPSAEDLSLTRTLKEGARLLQINVLDHIIISHQGYCSFSEEGLI